MIQIGFCAHSQITEQVGVGRQRLMKSVNPKTSILMLNVMILSEVIPFPLVWATHEEQTGRGAGE
jgi:hypothetical protein